MGIEARSRLSEIFSREEMLEQIAEAREAAWLKVVENRDLTKVSDRSLIAMVEELEAIDERTWRNAQ